MNAGKLFQCDELEYRLQVELQMFGDVGEAASTGTLTLEFETVWLKLYASRNYKKYRYHLNDCNQPRPSHWISVQLSVSPWGSDLYEQDGATSLEVRFRVLQPRWYSHTGYFALHYDRMELLVNNFLWHSLPSGVLYSDALRPSAVPLLGACTLGVQQPTVLGDTGDPCNPPDPPIDDWNATVVSTVRGGWRFRIGTEWHTFPIAIPPIEWEPTPCLPNGYQNLPTITALNTAEVILTATAHNFQLDSSEEIVQCQCESVETGQTFSFQTPFRHVRTDSYAGSASLVILPHLPKQYVRLGEHTALWLRYGFPETALVRSQFSHRLGDCQNADCFSETRSRSTLHPAKPSFLATVQQDPHLIEQEILSQLTYSLPSLYYRRSRTDLCTPLRVPAECIPETVSCPGCRYCIADGLEAQVNYEVVPPPDGIPFFVGSGLEDRFRYINSWANPHWNYFLFWDHWELDGAPAPFPDYWLPLRTQYLWHAQLPINEQLRRRNLLLLEPLLESPYLGWISMTLTGYPTHWCGALRWDSLPLTRRPAVQADERSQSRWSWTNATATYSGTTITLTNLTSSTLQGEFELADSETYPYLYPALTDRLLILTIDPSPTQLIVEAINQVGESATLPLVEANTWAILSAPETTYAGTWGQSYAGLLGNYSEIGQDLLPGGQSVPTMANPIRKTLLALLHPRMPAKIRLTLHYDTPPSTVQLSQPIFQWLASSTITFPLTGNTQAVLRERNGFQAGGVRWDAIPPEPLLPHQPPSLVEALMLKKLLYEAQSRWENIDDEIAALYDEWEGNNRAAAQSHTRAIFYPFEETLPDSNEPILFLFNGFREIPPLATLPRKARTRETHWQETGDYVQASYVYAPYKRYWINPNRKAALWRVENGMRTLWSQSTSSHGFWQISIADQPVLNTETMQRENPRFLLRLTATDEDFARITPFWGHWMSRSAPPPTAPRIYHAYPDYTTNRLHLLAVDSKDQFYFGTYEVDRRRVSWQQTAEQSPSFRLGAAELILEFVEEDPNAPDDERYRYRLQQKGQTLHDNLRFGGRLPKIAFNPTHLVISTASRQNWFRVYFYRVDERERIRWSTKRLATFPVVPPWDAPYPSCFTDFFGSILFSVYPVVSPPPDEQGHVHILIAERTLSRTNPDIARDYDFFQEAVIFSMHEFFDPDETSHHLYYPYLCPTDWSYWITAVDSSQNRIYLLELLQPRVNPQNPKTFRTAILSNLPFTLARWYAVMGHTGSGFYLFALDDQHQTHVGFYDGGNQVLWFPQAF